MFSWRSSKEQKAPPPSPVYDPLKNNAGASAFFKQPPGDSRTAVPFAVKPGGRGSSAAAFYGSATTDSGPVEGVEEINAFLREGRKVLEDAEQRHLINVVIGTEAADLDSMASAIALAYFLQKSADPGSSNVWHLPLVDVPRGDFHLRLEAAWLFNSMGLDVSALLFSDEVDLRELYETGKLQLLLVDHNKLSSKYQELEKCIVGIIDHHKPEDLYPWVTLRQVEQVGSCSSLVAHRISQSAAHLLANRALCRMLLAAILVDTGNLDASVGRCEEVDETMAALLISGAGSAGNSAFFETLREKKFEQGGLSTLELLRRDYKQWAMGPGVEKKKGEVVQVGISAVGLPLATLVGKDSHFADVARAFAAERGLHVLLVMSVYFSPSKKLKWSCGMAWAWREQKEVMVTSEVGSLLTSLAYYLQNEQQNLQLKGITIKGLPANTKAYQQGNLAASRKQIAPLLFHFFDKGS